MLTVTYNGMEYQCATAYRGEDSVRLVDENGVLVADFEGVCDFSAFTCVDENGAADCWITCPSENECYPVVAGADGKTRKSETKFFNIATVLDWYEDLAAGPEAADKPSTWMDLGPGIAFIEEGTLRNQPCDKGFLINLAHKRASDQRLPIIGQLLVSTDYNEPCKVWMRKNLTTKRDAPTQSVVNSTTTWDNTEQWIQLLDKNDIVYVPSAIRISRVNKYSFTGGDYNSGLNVFTDNYNEARTNFTSGNLYEGIRDNPPNMEASSKVKGVVVGKSINYVRASLHIPCLASDSGDISFRLMVITKNGSVKLIPAEGTQYIPAGKKAVVSISTNFYVTEGDFIYVSVYSDAQMTLDSGFAGTHLSVEAIG